jgi:endonuclease G
MRTFRLRALIGCAVLVAAALGALADTGTPFPAGTSVEVGTPAGTVKGVLEDRTKEGWVLVREPGQDAATAIPEKNIGFVKTTKTVATGNNKKGTTGGSNPPAAEDTSTAASEHFIHGQPRVAKLERFAFRPVPGGPLVDGVTVLKRFAFTVGHYDKHKTPAWVSMKWSKAQHAVPKPTPPHARPFKEDTDLPLYARTGRDYDYQNTGYQRGHMARHEDLSKSGPASDPQRASREGCLMSNIVPQQQQGHNVWGKLEDEHRDVVGKPALGIDTVWIVSGPVFKNGLADKVIGQDRVGAPAAMYKIVAWEKDGTLHARGYIIKQNDTNTELKTYLVTIDKIEEETGLDFFPDLPEAEEAALEAKQFQTLWGPN